MHDELTNNMPFERSTTLFINRRSGSLLSDTAVSQNMGKYFTYWADACRPNCEQATFTPAVDCFFVTTRATTTVISTELHPTITANNNPSATVIIRKYRF